MIKKMILSMLAGLFVLPTFAQYGTARERSRYHHDDTESYYGVRMGVNASSVTSNEAQFDLGARTGFSISGVYGIQLSNDTPIWMEFGLGYTEKGGKVTVAGSKHTYRLGYLQVPCVVKYSVDVDDDFFVQPFGGIYASLGVAGKHKDFGNRASGSVYSSNGFRRFDAGLRIGCGAEYNKLYAEVGLDLGLANVIGSDFEAARNRSLFLNVGVNF